MSPMHAICPADLTRMYLSIYWGYIDDAVSGSDYIVSNCRIGEYSVLI